MNRVHIRGIGAAVPEHVVPNETLAKLNGIEPAWIVERTGIERRHLSNRLEKTSTFATAAAREALEMAGLSPADVDFLVLATSFPDSVLPQSTAGVVKDRLRLTKAVAFDVSTPAIGYVVALQIAHRYVESGAAENVLVVGAECFSSFADLRDRRICYLFGDGAGAMLLSREGGFATLGAPLVEAIGPADNGGPNHDPGAPVDHTYSLPLYHQPREKLQEGFERTLERLVAAQELTTEQVRFVLPQQMHSMAVEQAGEHMHLRQGALFQDLLHAGNLLSATLPLSFYHLAVSRKIQKGESTALLGTDGRHHWGGAVLTLTDELPGGVREAPALEAPATRHATIPQVPAYAPSNFRAVAELPEILADEVRKADLFGSALSTVLFRVGHGEPEGGAVTEQMSRETRLLLSRQIRRRDLVVEVAANRFAVILPNQDTADARRIADRLKRLLERLDPCEEIEIEALYDLVTFRAGGGIDTYVGEVLRLTGA